MKINYHIILTAMLLLGMSISSKSQQITRAEYFFDSDPGVGNATAITLSVGDTLDTTFSIPVDGLASGFHQLYIRVAEEDTLWSLFEGRTFYVLSQSATPAEGSPITGAEYFFDSDPGIGQGTALDVTGSDTVNKVFNLDVASLSTGFHQLYVRFKDESNKWSLFEGRTLYVLQSAEQSPSPKVVSLEYFIGDDPGIGNGTEMTFATADTISMDTLIDIASQGLSAGEYQLSMRVKDAGGNWSHTESRTFRICGSIPDEPLVYDGMVCREGAVQLAAEGAGDGNYRWYDPDRQLIDGSTDSLLTTSHLTDSATYYVTAINAEGCESEMTPIVAAVIKTEVEAGVNDTLSYASDTVALEPGKPGHGLWYGSDAVVDSLYFDLSAGTGSYGLTYEVDVEGCKFNDTRTVVVEKATQTITFDNLHDITFDQSPVNLSATSGSGLPVSFVLSEGDGTINGDKLTIDSTGVFTIHAIQEGNSNYLAADTVTRSFTVSKGTATISLSALNQTYDGAGKKVAVETTPAGLAVETLYEGSPELPVDAGKYEVVVTIEDDNYAGMVTDSLEIAKAEATIKFSNLKQVYDGNGKSVDLTVTPGGLNAEVLYEGSAKLPVNAGRYEVVATIQDENYEGSLSDSLEITKATASVTLSDMEQTYDGTGKSVEVQTEPSGLSVSVMYDGSETLPVDAGEYKVSASVDDNNWQGTTTGVIKIQKQTATIEISDLEHEYDGSAKEVTIATTPAGLDYEVTYDGSSTAPVEAGTYEVVAEIAENNYKGSASAEMTIHEEAQTGLSDIMNGNIRIYPNPFDDRVKVILPEERSFHYLKISSLTGSVVAVRRIYKNEKILTLDLASLEEGIYILTLYSDKGRYNLKMNKISQ